MATIDKNSRLISEEDGGYMAAFRLHSGSEYGMVSFRAYDSHVGHYLVDEDSDYAFTWDSTWHYGFDIYFVDLQQRSIEKVGNDRYYDRDVNGKRVSLRGFPGATKVELIYDLDPTWKAYVEDASFGDNWTKARTLYDLTVQDTFTLKEGASLLEYIAFGRNFPENSTSDQNIPIHFRSISIYYTC